MVMQSDLTEDLLEWARSRYFGKYRGTVTNNMDAAQMGRVQVSVPAVLGDVNVWAMPCVPYAGDGVGFYAIPDAGTGVWVEFEAGDPSYPIWSGCFWAAGELPDPAGPSVKIWKTSGLTIRLDDMANEAKFESSLGASITLTDSAVTETMTATHTVGTDITSEVGTATVTVAMSGITLDAGMTAEVTMASFSVGSGALQVM